MFTGRIFVALALAFGAVPVARSAATEAPAAAAMMQDVARLHGAGQLDRLARHAQRLAGVEDCQAPSLVADFNRQNPHDAP